VQKSLSRFQPTHFIVHYNEVALKGKNRGWFEGILARNIRHALRATQRATVRRLYGRLLVPVSIETDWSWAAERLSRVFGIAHIVPAVTAEPSVEALQDTVGELVRGETEPRSFGVHCKRATKEFPFTSMDVQREVGARVKQITAWPVDLGHPDLPILIEIVNKQAFVGFGRIDGPGGLPVGVAGSVVCLLSGGIDSPVAAYRLLRRGATVIYTHFHSYPHTGIESQKKVEELAERIQPPGTRAKLYNVPFAELQRRIVAGCPAPLRVILYRRFMVRTAEAIARKAGALALATGENLGQVASQTLENLATINAVSDLPILRPLIGMDKREIIEDARRIGTYDISIEPHDDCCSYLMPPNPATHSTTTDLERAEATFDVDAEVGQLVSNSVLVELGEVNHDTPLPRHQRVTGGS